MNIKKKLPDWNEDPNNDCFTISIKKGIKKSHLKSVSTAKINKTPLSIEEHIAGVLENKRRILSQTITLIESRLPAHNQKAEEIIQKLLPHSGNSIRIAISGVPGAGKSTLIEELGLILIQRGYKVAVLAIDPTSSLSGGSILGDKTRMEKLSRSPQAFIRPSPTGGNLGGVAKKTRETINICEAAGYNFIIIETVGIGQSEITVRSMVDFFLLVLIAGGGDELQGIKRGVMEICDAVIINKSDGNNELPAQSAKTTYQNALHLLTPVTEGWKPRVHTCSAIRKKGLLEILQTIDEFHKITKDNMFFTTRRSKQSFEWLISLINDKLKEVFYSNPLINDELAHLKDKVTKNQLFPVIAAKKLLDKFLS
jgi:LAO/AO transport system kinase